MAGYRHSASRPLDEPQIPPGREPGATPGRRSTFDNQTSHSLAFAIETAVSGARKPRMFRAFSLQRGLALAGETDACTMLVKDGEGRIFLVRVNRYA